VSRRSSAFNDDLAGLDELARLPLPDQTLRSAAKASSAAAPAPDRGVRDRTLTESADIAVASDESHGALKAHATAASTSADQREASSGQAGVREEAAAASKHHLDEAAGRTFSAQRPNLQDAAGSDVDLDMADDNASALRADAGGRASSATGAVGERSGRRSGNVQTAVRLPRDVSKWLTEQAHRQQLTHSSVVAQAVLANREALSPELPFGDGLLVRRRPRSDSAPITLRFTPAQLQLVDGLAQAFGCTRSALVLAALRAAIGRPRSS